jgi:hypothetical protein
MSLPRIFADVAALSFWCAAQAACRKGAVEEIRTDLLSRFWPTAFDQ